MRSRLVVAAVLAASLVVPGSALAQDPSVAPSAAPSPVEAPLTSPAPVASPAPDVSLAVVPDPDPEETSVAGLPRGTVRLMAVGDVMLGRSIGKRIRADGPGIVFGGVQRVLDRADLLVINLECALTTSRDREDKRYTFKSPPVSADALALAGVDMASMANNHAGDWGDQGLLDTLRHLADRGIAAAGAGRDRAEARAPVIVRRNGLSVAFLGYVDAFTESTGFNTKAWRAGPGRPGLAIASTEAIRADVAAATSEADVVVVMIHAGYEYAPSPNAEQRRYARAALGAGATLVLGHHPHVLQGWTRKGSRLIHWSLGNFVFDRMGGASDTEILALDLSADGVSDVRTMPVRIVDGFPTLVN